MFLCFCSPCYGASGGNEDLVHVQHQQVQGTVEDETGSENSNKSSCLHMQTPEDEEDQEGQEVNCWGQRRDSNA